MNHNPDMLAEQEEIIGYRFQNRALLIEALTHRSALNEPASRDARDNERLEFLGDAVLGLLVASLLLERFPGKREGELSRLRASLVGEESLARLGHSLGLGRHLVMGKGEEQSGGRCRRSILADAFEALLAAVYLDGGPEPARRIVTAHFTPMLNVDGTAVIDRDFKTALQELSHARFGATPHYLLTGIEGPPHDHTFAVSVLVHDEVMGEGRGGSKKEASQEAARTALVRLDAIPAGETA
jgi:ribonuclease-3